MEQAPHAEDATYERGGLDSHDVCAEASGLYGARPHSSPDIEHPLPGLGIHEFDHRIVDIRSPHPGGQADVPQHGRQPLVVRMGVSMTPVLTVVVAAVVVGLDLAHTHDRTGSSPLEVKGTVSPGGDAA